MKLSRPGGEEALAPGVAVDALGDADGDHAVGDAQFLEDGAHRRHLSLAAVDQDHVGPGREGHIGRIRRRCRLAAVRNALFLEQPREAPRHHLAHHAEVVARRDVGRFDVELAVLVLHEAFRPRDHHAADGIGAHDVRVVVDLDALRHIGQAGTSP